MADLISVVQPCVLVVEGEDDQRFFESLLRHCGISGVQVLQTVGKSNLRGVLKALVRAPGFDKVHAVGVIRDADDDGKAAFQSACDALVSAGLDRPAEHCEVTSGFPAVAVMIVPDCTRGALEDLCLLFVTADSAIGCVDLFFSCLESAGVRPRNLSKARVQAFLACRPVPGKRLGEAAQTGYWPLDAEVFEPARALFRKLVEGGGRTS